MQTNKAKCRALLGAGLCDWAGRMPGKPARLQNREKHTFCFTISKQLILCTLRSTIRFLTFPGSSRGKFGTLSADRVHLWKTVMTASFERDGEEAARKMFPLHLWKLWMSLLIVRECSRAGPINQSGSLRWRHFINMFETCLAASGLNGLQRPAAEEEGEREPKKIARSQTGRAGACTAGGRGGGLSPPLEAGTELDCWSAFSSPCCKHVMPYALHITNAPTFASSLLVHKTSHLRSS